MTAFNKAWGVVKDIIDEETGFDRDRLEGQAMMLAGIEAIRTACEARIDEDCTGKAEWMVEGTEMRVYVCGPCVDHAPGNATIERIEKAWIEAQDETTCPDCGKGQGHSQRENFSCKYCGATVHSMGLESGD
jgi:DNA-directed RNA polymerase subunit RPC12/RpoP